jgi:hypothetical protein
MAGLVVVGSMRAYERQRQRRAKNSRELVAIPGSFEVSRVQLEVRGAGGC